jgi:ABC-type transporter Mla maintaining outer membrane lipid asymmetry permease subunit MlaE
LGSLLSPSACLIGRLGALVWDQWAALRHAAAVIGTVLGVSVRPRSWARPGRAAFVQQVMAIGVVPLGVVGVLAAFLGVSVVVQLSFWNGEAGQSQLLGPLLVAIVARELGPVLINLVVIVRSGTAMTTTLGLLRTSGEVRALERQPLCCLRSRSGLCNVLPGRSVANRREVGRHTDGWVEGCRFGRLAQKPCVPVPMM